MMSPHGVSLSLLVVGAGVGATVVADVIGVVTGALVVGGTVGASVGGGAAVVGVSAVTVVVWAPSGAVHEPSPMTSNSPTAEPTITLRMFTSGIRGTGFSAFVPLYGEHLGGLRDPLQLARPPVDERERLADAQFAHGERHADLSR